MKRSVIGSILILANAAWIIYLVLHAWNSPLVRSADDSLRSSLASGSKSLVIKRQPYTTSGIVIYDFSSAQRGHHVTASTYPVQADGSIVDVSFPILGDDWQRLNTIRQRWCTTLPTTQRSGWAMADYVIGLRCQSALDVRIVYLARADVPPEIITVIERMDHALAENGFPPP